MSDMSRWSPFRELDRFRAEMDRMFEEFMGGRGREWGSRVGMKSFPSTRREMVFSPSLDLYEKDNYLMVVAELPGVKKEDIHVTVEDNRLKLNAVTKREEEINDDNYYLAERSYGTYTRTLELPAAVNYDQVEARYEDGVLTLRIPKMKEAKPREIPIK